MINNGFILDKNDYEFCVKVENMIIFVEGYFGIFVVIGGFVGKFYLLILKVCELSLIGNSICWSCVDLFIFNFVRLVVIFL